MSPKVNEEFILTVEKSVEEIERLRLQDEQIRQVPEKMSPPINYTQPIQQQQQPPLFYETPTNLQNKQNQEMQQQQQQQQNPEIEEQENYTIPIREAIHENKLTALNQQQQQQQQQRLNT